LPRRGTASQRTETLRGGYYLGADPASPQVGDLKISFEVVKPLTVSIVSRQIGGTFEPYMTQVGRPIQILEVGPLSADTMFAQARSSNSTLTWVLRLVGVLVMWFGFALIFAPLAVLADVLPLLGDIVRLGTGLIAGAASLGISLVIIALAWLFYRPVSRYSSSSSAQARCTAYSVCSNSAKANAPTSDGKL